MRKLLALGWLVLELSDSGTALGIVVALQYAPILLFGPYIGVVVDRSDRRRLMMATQIGGGLIAIALAGLTATDVITVWMVGLASFALGVVNCFDHPGRQLLVRELVGPDMLHNALALSNVLYGIGRVAEVSARS